MCCHRAAQRLRGRSMDHHDHDSQASNTTPTLRQRFKSTGGHALVVLGTILARALGPIVIVAICAVSIFPIIFTVSLAFRVWFFSDLDAGRAVLELHQTAGELWSNFVGLFSPIILVAIASIITGLCAEKLGSRILGRYDDLRVKAGRKQNVGKMLYNCGRAMQFLIKVLAILVVGATGIGLAIVGIIHLASTPSGSYGIFTSIGRLQEIQSPSEEYSALMDIFVIPLALAGIYIVGGELVRSGKRLDDRIVDHKDATEPRTLPQHDDTNDPSTAGPAEQS